MGRVRRAGGGGKTEVMGAGPKIGLRLHWAGRVHYFTPCSKKLRKGEIIIIFLFIDGETKCRDIGGLAKSTYEEGHQSLNLGQSCL